MGDEEEAMSLSREENLNINIFQIENNKNLALELEKNRNVKTPEVGMHFDSYDTLFTYYIEYGN